MIVFFLRGLNTYGNDSLNFGPLPVGDMAKHWIKAMRPVSDMQFIVVRGLGVGTFNDYIARAKSFIESECFKHPEYLKQQIHLLGHSLGGVIARALPHHLDKTISVRSVVSIASPHHGSLLAQSIIEKLETQTEHFRLLNLVGYNVKDRLHHFIHIRPEEMQIFNQRYSDIPSIRYACCLCRAKESDLSWPMKVSLLMSPPGIRAVESDGMVELTAQKWGDVIGTFALDHLSELGFNFYLRQTARNHAKREFQKIQKELLSFWSALK